MFSTNLLLALIAPLSSTLPLHHPHLQNTVIMMNRQNEDLTPVVGTEHVRFRPPHQVWRYVLDIQARELRWHLQADEGLLMPGQDHRPNTRGRHAKYLHHVLNRGHEIKDVIFGVYYFAIVRQGVDSLERRLAIVRWLTMIVSTINNLQDHLFFVSHADLGDDAFWAAHQMWLRFRWEDLVPSSPAVAEAFRSTLREYLVPAFEWKAWNVRRGRWETTRPWL